ncbi:MAG: hypothetical protein C4325_05650 [Blastocatellia bacterium]
MSKRAAGPTGRKAFSQLNIRPTPSLRAKTQSAVKRSLRRQGQARSNQHEVWSDLASKFEALKSESETMSFYEMAEQNVSPEVEKSLFETIEPQPGQIGFLTFIRNGFAGGDIFGSEELCK